MLCCRLPQTCAAFAAWTARQAGRLVSALAIGEYSNTLLDCFFLNRDIARMCMSVVACSLKVEVRTLVVPSMNAVR